MKKSHYIFPFLGILLLASACDKTEKGSGEIITENRTIPAADKVSVSCDCNVYITPDAGYSMMLSGEDNILPQLKTEMNGRDLTIKYADPKKNYKHKTVDIYLKAPTVYALDMAGSGKIVSTLNTVNNTNLSGSGNIETGVSGAEVEAKVSGSGNTTLRGATDKAILNISGSGNIYALSLAAKNAEVTVSGSGSAELSVTDNLKATISGSGSIWYAGNPVVTQNVSGSGKVNRK